MRAHSARTARLSFGWAARMRNAWTSSILLARDSGRTNSRALPVEERRFAHAGLADHRLGPLERQQVEVRVRPHGEPRAAGVGPFEERAVRQAVGLVDLER